VIELMDQVGISGPGEQGCFGLFSATSSSGGGHANQRVMIAMRRSPAIRSLLIADEPTTARGCHYQGGRSFDLLCLCNAGSWYGVILIYQLHGRVSDTHRAVAYVCRAPRFMDTGARSRGAVRVAAAALYGRPCWRPRPGRSEAEGAGHHSGVVPGLHIGPRGCLFSPR